MRYVLIDGAFAQLSERWASPDTGPVDLASPLGQLLLRSGRDSVAQMPLEPPVLSRRIKRQAWWATNDLEVMRTIELPHTCEICEGGRETLVRFLTANPGQAVAWGRLDLEETAQPTNIGTVGSMNAGGNLLTGDHVPETIVVGELCSMCKHPLDPHELWVGPMTSPVQGKMTCPEPDCQCLSDWSAL